jgi:hypothetical protein
MEEQKFLTNQGLIQGVALSSHAFLIAVSAEILRFVGIP